LRSRRAAPDAARRVLSVTVGAEPGGVTGVGLGDRGTLPPPRDDDPTLSPRVR
jgi:hypothetical protein